MSEYYTQHWYGYKLGLTEKNKALFQKIWDLRKEKIREGNFTDSAYPIMYVDRETLTIHKEEGAGIYHQIYMSNSENLSYGIGIMLIDELWYDVPHSTIERLIAPLKEKFSELMETYLSAMDFLRPIIPDKEPFYFRLTQST